MAFFDFLGAMFSSIYFWTPIIGWFSAQMIKVVISIVRDRRFSLRMLMASGGMPSSHSSTVMSLTTCIATLMSPSDPLFAVMFVVSFIVMYDAAGVRLETGKQAKILNKLTADLFSDGTKKYLDRDLKELVGHTPMQVVAGALLGIAVGYIIPFLWVLH